MKLFLPKSIIIKFENHGNGWASMEYSEVTEMPNPRKAKISAAHTRLVMRKLKDSIRKLPLFKSQQHGERFDYKCKVSGKKIYTYINMTHTVENIINSLVGELQMQITPMNEIKKKVTKVIKKLVNKKGIKEINKKVKIINKKYGVK